MSSLQDEIHTPTLHPLCRQAGRQAEAARIVDSLESTVGFWSSSFPRTEQTEASCQVENAEMGQRKR